MQSEVIHVIRAQADEPREHASNKSGKSNTSREENGSAAERKLELKICERCGGLWLRPAGSRWIYCGPCKRKVEALPQRTEKPSKRGAKVKGAPARKERVQ